MVGREMTNDQLCEHACSDTHLCLPQAMAGIQSNPELMRQMMQGQTSQLLQNPQLMAEMMQNPAIQQTMESLMNNPAMLEQMMASNPMFGGNRDMVSTYTNRHLEEGLE